MNFFDSTRKGNCLDPTNKNHLARQYNIILDSSSNLENLNDFENIIGLD